ncbi:hypothetical protein CSF_1397 [Campylobacter sputorum bv. faecalis CCUG 20703]|nr:hypothetical protein CSF_1397 [Campylobacter sputorum bv. faecalis CCUG 20703]
MVDKDMKLEDLAKSVADEISAELEQEREQQIYKSEQKVDDNAHNIAQIKQELNQIDGDNNTKEQIFLQNTKERILVLFEGLNENTKGDISLRLDLTIKFLEFLLASIENRLDELRK